MMRRSLDEQQFTRHHLSAYAARNVRYPKIVLFNGSLWASLEDALCYSCTGLAPWKVEEFKQEVDKRKLKKQIYSGVVYYHVSALYQVGHELDIRNGDNLFRRGLRRMHT